MISDLTFNTFTQPGGTTVNWSQFPASVLQGFYAAFAAFPNMRVTTTTDITDPNLKLWSGYYNSSQVYVQAPCQPGNSLVGIGPSSSSSLLIPISPQQNLLLMLTYNINNGTEGGCYPYTVSSWQLVGNSIQITFNAPVITKSNNGAPQTITISVTEASAR